MSDPTPLEEFTALVLKNLEKNGFPQKSVSFPLEKMYEGASQRGFSFNKVRDALKQKDILSEISGDRMIFTQSRSTGDTFDLADMAEVAQQMYANMSEEQRAQISEMVRKMSPDDIAEIQKQWENMPADERARAMKNMQDKLP